MVCVILPILVSIWVLIHNWPNSSNFSGDAKRYIISASKHNCKQATHIGVCCTNLFKTHIDCRRTIVAFSHICDIWEGWMHQGLGRVHDRNNTIIMESYESGPRFNIKILLPDMEISIIKIRRPLDRLIFMIWIYMRRYLYTETPSEGFPYPANSTVWCVLLALC